MPLLDCGIHRDTHGARSQNNSLLCFVFSHVLSQRHERVHDQDCFQVVSLLFVCQIVFMDLPVSFVRLSLALGLIVLACLAACLGRTCLVACICLGPCLLCG